MGEEEKVGLGSFVGKLSGRPVEPYVLHNPNTGELTGGIEYASSDVTPNSSNQLEKSDARITEKAAADERVHNLFNQNSWMNFFGTQALGAAAAGLGAVTAPYVGALMTPSTYLDLIGAPAWLGTTANLGTSGYFLYDNGKEFVKDPSLYNGVMTALSAIPMTRSSSDYTNWFAKALRGVSGGKYTGYGYMGNVLHNTPLTGEYVANGFTPTTLFTKGQTNPYFTPEPYKILEIPGAYMPKSLARGSLLEKQLSKQGTISIKLLQLYLNKPEVSKVDKELISQVLANHTADKFIDYNDLRKEVSELIPSYEDIGLEDTWAAYGMKELGYKAPSRQEIIHKTRYGGGYDASKNGKLPTDPSVKEIYSLTFNNPSVGGSTNHFNSAPIGHSRFFTTYDEPGVLYVPETQSDWAQWFNKNTPKDQEKNIISEYMAKNYLDRHLQENLDFASTRGYKTMRYPTRETAITVEGYEPQEIPQWAPGLKKLYEFLNERASKFKDVVNNHGYLSDLLNLVKENPKYANDPRITKFIEFLLTNPTNKDRVNYYRSLLKDPYTDGDLTTLLDKYMLNYVRDQRTADVMENIFDHYTMRSRQMMDEVPKIEDYTDAHKTILKKYSDFPKLFKKLFGTEPSIVTDPKGNTWYEVNVPERYASSEKIFKLGGKLK